MSSYTKDAHNQRGARPDTPDAAEGVRKEDGFKASVWGVINEQPVAESFAYDNFNDTTIQH
ncbi:hypothetical protein H0H93_011717 [Arthromyces matolae]|nr:hypothetical protein H0H93_011717 [Arthromyces matolae]